MPSGAERGLVPARQRHGRFIRWWHGEIEIWCGDLCDLEGPDLDEIAAVYDCTATSRSEGSSKRVYGLTNANANATSFDSRTPGETNSIAWLVNHEPGDPAKAGWVS